MILKASVDPENVKARDYVLVELKKSLNYYGFIFQEETRILNEFYIFRCQSEWQIDLSDIVLTLSDPRSARTADILSFNKDLAFITYMIIVVKIIRFKLISV